MTNMESHNVPREYSARDLLEHLRRAGGWEAKRGKLCAYYLPELRVIALSAGTACRLRQCTANTLRAKPHLMIDLDNLPLDDCARIELEERGNI